MGTDTTPNTTSETQAAPEKVYVKIPKAGPGQGYHAPKNYQQPLLDSASKVIIVLLCASIPLATGLIFAMILGVSAPSRTQFLWLWIPVIIFVFAFASPSRTLT